MRAAIVENGIVKNIVEADKGFDGAVPTGDLTVRIGDSCDGTDFYRDGEKVTEQEGLDVVIRTTEEMLADCVEALSALGVKLDQKEPRRTRNPTVLKQAPQLRAAIQMLGRTAADDVALSCPALFDEWKAGTDYVTGDIRAEDGQLYRCLQDHTSQEDWMPSAAHSLWVRIADPAEEWPDWVQPAGSTDAYAKDAKVTHNGRRWISDVDSNVWEPGVYGWTEREE